MPDPKGWRLPEPEDDVAFEVICLDLFKAYKRPLVEPERFGRSGQAQHGVDFVLELPDGPHGYQCKCTRKLSFAAIEAEVQKSASFRAPLRSFTILTTAARDARVQERVSSMNLDRRRAGQFLVTVIHWESIQDLLAEHIEILKFHYPELTPDLVDLLQARARRLDREFPGSTLSYEARPGSTNVTLHPGPGGIPFKATFFGRDVHDRLLEARRDGRSVVIGAGEFDLRLPDALAFLVPGGRPARMEMRPAINGRSGRIRLLVQPQGAHHTLAMFSRRGRGSAEGVCATMTAIEVGTHRSLVEVQPDGLPLKLTIEMREGDDGSRAGGCDVAMSQVGARAAAALLAERIVQTLYCGSYVGVFTPEGDTIFAFEAPAVPEWGTENLEQLELLADLAMAADWDLRVPDYTSADELARAASLLELFTEGRAAVGRGGRLRWTVTSPSAVAMLRERLDGMSVRASSPPQPIDLWGQTFWVPATRFTALRAELTEASREALLTATDPPVSIELVVPDSVDVVEELVPVARIDFAAFLERLATEAEVSEGERRAYLRDGHLDGDVERVRLEIVRLLASETASLRSRADRVLALASELRAVREDAAGECVAPPDPITPPARTRAPR